MTLRQLNQVQIVDDLETRVTFVLTQLDQERQTIIDWLSPLNFSMTQNDIFNRRQEGTGEELLKSSEFQSWLSTSGDTLWCPGIRRSCPKHSSI